MSLRNRINKIEEQISGGKQLMIVEVPYELNCSGNEKTRRVYIERHYPKASDFNGLLIMVSDFGKILLETDL